MLIKKLDYAFIPALKIMASKEPLAIIPPTPVLRCAPQALLEMPTLIIASVSKPAPEDPLPIILPPDALTHAQQVRLLSAMLATGHVLKAVQLIYGQTPKQDYAHLIAPLAFD